MAARPPNREGPANGQPAGPTPNATPTTKIGSIILPARGDRGHGTGEPRRRP